MEIGRAANKLIRDHMIFFDLSITKRSFCSGEFSSCTGYGIQIGNDSDCTVVKTCQYLQEFTLQAEELQADMGTLNCWTLML